MIEVEFFRWHILDAFTGKPYLSRHRMTREDALQRHPGATPDLATREVRQLPDEGLTQHRTPPNPRG